MDYTILKDLVQSIGFPIFVAVYLLVEFKKTIGKLEETIAKNTEVLAKICEKMDIREEGK